MRCRFRKICFGRAGGFTIGEVVMALAILGFIAAGVFTVITRYVESATNSKSRMLAFEIARDNMEELLTRNSVEEFVEFGTSEENPDIQWETIVEPFYEPLSNRMWIRAITSASYTDTEGEVQFVTLEHWLTDVTKKQIMQIIDQKRREEQFYNALEELGDEGLSEEEYFGEEQLMPGDEGYDEYYGDGTAEDDGYVDNSRIGSRGRASGSTKVRPGYDMWKEGQERRSVRSSGSGVSADKPATTGRSLSYVPGGGNDDGGINSSGVPGESGYGDEGYGDDDGYDDGYGQGQSSEDRWANITNDEINQLSWDELMQYIRYLFSR